MLKRKRRCQYDARQPIQGIKENMKKKDDDCHTKITLKRKYDRGDKRTEEKKREMKENLKV